MPDKKRREHGSGQIVARGSGKYLLRYRNPATGKRVSKTVSAKNDKAASTAMREWINDLATDGRRDPILCMNELFDLYEADLRRNERASYSNVKLKLNRYLRPRFGDREIRSIRKSDLEAYIDHRRLEGAANGTINHELAYLTRAFRLGVDDGLLAMFPTVKKLDERSGIRLGFIEHEQYLAILAELHQHQKFLFACGYHWGMRRGELLKLRREWVRLHEIKPIVKIPGTVTKNGRVRTLPIYGYLEAWFDIAEAEWAETPSCPWMFSFRGQRLKDPREGYKAAV